MRNRKRTGRRALGALAAAVLLISPLAPAKAEGPGVSAESAVLISTRSGAVLYEKNAYESRAMASTTKIMTALLALEEAQRSGDPVVDITAEMVAVEGSSMGLQAGNRLRLSELAAGMLLASGNDAANACALFIAGSQEEFAKLMNQRASQIGLTGTNFVTPSGLDDDGHYSTAYDMALLAREALKNEKFAGIAGSFTRKVEFIEPEGIVTYTNHNKLLELYEGCTGVKTGFTKKAGRCLVSAAQRDGVALIAVTLNAPDDWDDHMALLDYGFSTVQPIAFDGTQVLGRLPLVGGSADSIAVQGAAGGTENFLKADAGEIQRRVLLPRFVYAPVQAGDEVGRVQYTIGGEEVYSVPILAKENAAPQEPKPPTFWERLRRWQWG